MELISTFAQDDAGNLIRTVTCHLYIRGTETHATGLQDANEQPLANPWTVTGDGKIQFRAPNGEYDLRCVGGGRDYRRAVQALDVGSQVSAAEDAAERAEDAQEAAEEFRDQAEEFRDQAEDQKDLAVSAKEQTLTYRNEAQNAAQSADSIAFQSGTITTDGRYGVTITHNKGDTIYTPKATVIGTVTQALRAGQISFVKAANTCVVYNTGDPVTIMYELSGVAS